MAKAICSAVIVLICGYLGCFLGMFGCMMGIAASATGCIVYAIVTGNRD